MEEVVAEVKFVKVVKKGRKESGGERTRDESYRRVRNTKGHVNDKRGIICSESASFKAAMVAKAKSQAWPASQLRRAGWRGGEGAGECGRASQCGASSKTIVNAVTRSNDCDLE